MSVEVVIVQTGTANLASVGAALVRAGCRVRVVESAREIDRAEMVVLPGVGSFGAAMTALERDGMSDVIRSRVRDERPTLAICLWFQILFEESEESPGVRGLGVLPGVIRRFTGEGVRVPQLGWNDVEPREEGGIVRRGHAYYANSYRLDEAPEGWKPAYTDYAGRFVGAVERGSVVACQFHPELSGAWGRALIVRWLASATKEAVTC